MYIAGRFGSLVSKPHSPIPKLTINIQPNDLPCTVNLQAEIEEDACLRSLCKGLRKYTLYLKEILVAKTGMLIRKPVGEVFEAIVNPDMITKFWFTKSSGRLKDSLWCLPV